MFNLFPKKKSVDDLVGSVGPFDVYRPTQTPSYVQAQSDIIEQFLKENHDLKAEKEKLELRLVAYQKITEGASSSISELTKEVKNLRHLKQENIELMERVNEIDNDVIRDLQDEVLVLKNANALWKTKHQIIKNDYTKCAQERDEFKDAFESMKRGYEQEAKSADRELEKRLEFNAEELLKRVTDYADSVTKEPTWEEAASDLALRVAKLEEQLKYTQTIICRK
jgi:cell division septum initiation protein DivIVA